MKKFVIAGVLAAVAVGSAQAQHRNPDGFYANRAWGNSVPVYQHQHRGDSGGRVAGAIIGGMILGAVLERAANQPAVVYQQAPVVVQQAPVVIEQPVCQTVYVRDVYGNFVPVGCR